MEFRIPRMEFPIPRAAPRIPRNSPRAPRIWSFHSESVFPEIGVVPRLLRCAIMQVSNSMRHQIFFAVVFGAKFRAWSVFTPRG